MSDVEFQPDWHEGEDAVPLVYLLGKLSLEWNMVEQYQTALMWKLLGSNSVGMAVSANLGNRPKQAIIAELAGQRPDAETLKPLLKLAARNFSALQENRNVLMHSHSIFQHQSGKLEWRKATGRGPSGHVSIFANEEDVSLIITQMVELGLFFVDLICYLTVSERGEKFEFRAALTDPIRLPIVDGGP